MPATRKAAKGRRPAARKPAPPKLPTKPLAQRIGVAAMEKRVARYKGIKGGIIHADQFIPGHEREMIPLIGLGVSENKDDPSVQPKIPFPAYGFTAAFARCGPGKGAGLHWHETEEVFMPVDGTWEIYWLEGKAERAVRIEAGDVISVPIAIYRGFRNVGRKTATLFAVVGGPDTGDVHWHPSMIAKAEAAGIPIDSHGVSQGLPVDAKPAKTKRAGKSRRAR
ncbi:MAG: cupin domain-containing protein [Alphaproteobacteria bacterium]